MAGSDEPGFEMAPTRIGRPGRGGGGRPGRGRFKPVVVILAALAIPAVAIAGPRIEWRPSIDLSALRPSPTTLVTPSPTPTDAPIPTATPLPSLTIATGPLPGEPLPIDASGFRLIDPATGTLGRTAGVRLDNDVVFRPTNGDGWWCVCFSRLQGPGSETVDVSVRQFDRDLGAGQTFRIATYQSLISPVSQEFGVRFDLERSADGRIAYLGVGQRSAAGWTVRVDAIDLEQGRLLGSHELATIAVPGAEAAPSPSAGESGIESYLMGPTLRLSPDDRRLLVSVNVDTFDSSAGTSSTAPYGWLVEVAPDGPTDDIGTITALEPRIVDLLGRCGWPAWLGPEEIVIECGGAGPSGDSVEFQSMDLAGRQTAAVTLSFRDRIQISEPLIDAANRIVYFWEGFAHILYRVDLNDGTSAQIDVHPARGATPAIATPIPGVRPLANLPPIWTRVTSDYRLYSAAQLVGEPGGTRLFALGMVAGRASQDSGRFGSSGIWVFDTRTFANVDQWPAVSAYTSMAISPDGRWLTAAGQAGIDVAGDPAGWEDSVAVHDTLDGRLVLQLGNLGEFQVLTLP
jgi:hypothetical protein